MSNFLLVKAAKYPLVSVGLLAAQRRIDYIFCTSYPTQLWAQWKWSAAGSNVQGTGLWVTHDLKAKPVTEQEKKPKQNEDWKLRGELTRSAELRVHSRDRTTTEFFPEQFSLRMMLFTQLLHCENKSNFGPICRGLDSVAELPGGGCGRNGFNHVQSQQFEFLTRGLTV